MNAHAAQGIRLVWGTEAISKLIGRTERQTAHLLKKGAIPAKKIGGRWVAEESQVIAYFMR